MATGASADSERQAYECPICTNYFVRPKLLWCGHTVCKPCLRTWAHISAVCPLCKANVRQSRSQPVAMDAVVDALPDDVAMATLVEAACLLGQESGECEECGEGGEYLCPDCRHVLCVTCRDVHNDPDVSRQHVLVELSEATAESLVAQLRGRCASHQHRVADLFCPAHNEALCPACASDRHGECPDVEAFQRHADRLADQLGDLKDRLTRAVDELRLETQVLAEQLEKAAVEREKAFEGVLHACDELIRHVEITREKLYESIVDSFDKVKRDIEDKKRSMDRLLSSLCAHVGVTERFQSTSPSNLSDAMSAIRPRVECLCQEKEEVTPKYMTTCAVDTAVLAEIKDQMRLLFLKELASLGPVYPVQVVDLETMYPNEARFYPMDGLVSDDALSAGYENGPWSLAMVTSALAPGYMYQVRVDTVRSQNNDFRCGVTDRGPATLTSGGWTQVVSSDRDRRVLLWALDGPLYHKNNHCCPALKRLAEGSRVGLGLRHDGTLVLHVNGVEQVRVSPLHGPCYVFFGLNPTYSKVSMLPLIRLPPD